MVHLRKCKTHLQLPLESLRVPVSESGPRSDLLLPAHVLVPHVPLGTPAPCHSPLQHPLH